MSANVYEPSNVIVRRHRLLPGRFGIFERRLRRRYNFGVTAAPFRHLLRCATWASSWTPLSLSSPTSRTSPNPTQKHLTTPAFTHTFSNLDTHPRRHHLPSGLLQRCPAWTAHQGPQQTPICLEFSCQGSNPHKALAAYPSHPPLAPLVNSQVTHHLQNSPAHLQITPWTLTPIPHRSSPPPLHSLTTVTHPAVLSQGSAGHPLHQIKDLLGQGILCQYSHTLGQPTTPNLLCSIPAHVQKHLKLFLFTKSFVPNLKNNLLGQLYLLGSRPRGFRGISVKNLSSEAPWDGAFA